jgi:4-amino-4-deoxy-L-arabinose transferase-like glycosyltransferase
VFGGTSGVARIPARERSPGLRVPRWSPSAWGAIAVAALFVAISCWWLASDRAVPFGGGASHLYASLLYLDWTQDGDPLRAIAYDTYYPPAIRLLGMVVFALFGTHPDGPVLAQNVVFVPLLALATYRVGRMAAGPRAGLLAVVFALGTPLLAEQFHVFMLDAPQAALVAVAVWLLLESERFARVGPAALAGVAVGVGMLTKQLMPLYLTGLVAALLSTGGWRNRRGLAAFVAAALVVAAPWYVVHLDEWDRFLGAAGTGSPTERVPEAASPPVVSLENLGWYGWATLNGLLFAPLFAFAAAGVAAALVRVVRVRPLPPGDPTVALLSGLGGAWLALTLMRHHDVRYTMGAIVFIAVLGTAWVVRLRPRAQLVSSGLLVAAVVVAQLGATFGAGRDPGQLPLSNGAIGQGEGVPPRDRIVVYSSLDYLVSGPLRDGDVLGLMRRLRAAGVERVATEDRGDVNDHLFETVGLVVFARAAGVGFEGFDPPQDGATVARLIRASSLDGSEPCTRLFNGTGVWVSVGDRVACPS